MTCGVSGLPLAKVDAPPGGPAGAATAARVGSGVGLRLADGAGLGVAVAVAVGTGGALLGAGVAVGAGLACASWVSADGALASAAGSAAASAVSVAVADSDSDSDSAVEASAGSSWSASLAASTAGTSSVASASASARAARRRASSVRRSLSSSGAVVPARSASGALMSSDNWPCSGGVTSITVSSARISKRPEGSGAGFRGRSRTSSAVTRLRSTSTDVLIGNNRCSPYEVPNAVATAARVMMSKRMTDVFSSNRETGAGLRPCFV